MRLDVLIKTKYAQIVQLFEKIELLEIEVISLQDKYNKVNSMKIKLKRQRNKSQQHLMAWTK